MLKHWFILMVGKLYSIICFIFYVEDVEYLIVKQPNH